MAARPSWQGHLKLSLVTCPIALYNAISPRGDVHFNLINPETGNRIRMVTVDAGTDEPVDRKTLIKGFEIEKDRFVTVTPEEIEAVRLESTKTIEIGQFVPASDIDRLYWDTPYYLVADGKMAAEPYAVIRAAMEREGQIALGRVVMSQRERLLALEPRERGIIATTLRSHDEVRPYKSLFDEIPDVKPDSDMVAIAQKIIAQKETDFDPGEFEDRYEDALRELIARKQKGHKIIRAEEPERSNVIDLMDALRKSLKGGSKTQSQPASGRPAPRKGPRAAALKRRAKR